VTYRALVPNARGAQRAAAAGVDEILGLMTISATYLRKNQNMTIDEAIAQNLESFRIADASGTPFVMALGMAFWCAYEGTIPEERVLEVTQRLHDGGIRSFYLAGSLGMEDPAHVNRLFLRLRGRFPAATFGFHIHNLSGMATANILAALDAGVEWLEGAICGIGGGIAMPTTIGSVGNFPTEDLVSMLSEMGIETGLDPAKTVAASRDIATLLGIAPQSHRGSGATRDAIRNAAVTNPREHP
jgi:hydroxymethylglutaryl-CoA lyase